jgi:hypothetical protein
MLAGLVVADDGPPEEQRSQALEHAAHLLATRGHDLGFGRARVAVGRSGVAVGFPTDPMVHVSWWVVGLIVVAGAWRRRRGAKLRRPR